MSGHDPSVGAPGPGAVRDASVREVVRAAIASSLERLLSHEVGARVGGDPEDVHQARVATRRLRSDLRSFRPFLDPGWAEGLRGELRWLGDALGAVRDAEVLRDRLASRAPRLRADERPALRVLLAELERRREDARRELSRVMADERYGVLVGWLHDAAQSPAVLEGARDRPARDASSEVLARPWRRLERAVERAGDAPTDAALHAVRIRTKRVRYAAEALSPVYGRAALAFAADAAALQDVLGEHQDAVVAAAFLREAAGSSPGAAFVAGRLAGMEDEERRAARLAWRRAWARLARPKRRFWA